MDWHPFSGPWGAFVCGMVCGAWVVVVVYAIILLRMAKAQKR
jgi:hypothetical protein